LDSDDGYCRVTNFVIQISKLASPAKLPRMIHGLVVGIAMAASAIAGGAQKDALRIVVIEGEGAVNVIQQKTAVAPVVEVRDRNNLPVPGATVTFSIGGKGAAFGGGAQTVTITTNTAGRAAVAAFNPLGSGSVQIQVSAAFQGQTAVATIAQTNVLTAAEAVAAGASGAGGSSGGTAATGGAGGGGGLSGTTIGILGAGAAAAAGGALVATGVVGGGSDLPVVTGSYSGQFVNTTTVTTDRVTVCESTRTVLGTVTMDLNPKEGRDTGRADVTVTDREIAFTSSPLCSPYAGSTATLRADINGTSSPSWSATSGGGGITVRLTFAGTLIDGVVTGTLTYTVSGSFQQAQGGGTVTQSGSVTTPITLR
jgi:hypothetical protein